MIYYFLRKPEWKTFNPWLVMCVWTFSVIFFHGFAPQRIEIFWHMKYLQTGGVHLGFCRITQNDFNLHLLQAYKQWISILNMRPQKGNPSYQWMLRIKEYLCHFGEMLQFFSTFKKGYFLSYSKLNILR